MDGMRMAAAAHNMESAFQGEYIHNPMRTLTLTTSRQVGELIEPLRAWARDINFHFRVGSPTGQSDSVSVEMWNQRFVWEGDNRVGAPGLDFTLYLNTDSVDNHEIDRLTDQLESVLASYGSVKVVAAPHGTPPRIQPRR